MSPPLTGLWISIPRIFYSLDKVPDKYRHVWISRKQNAHAPVLNAVKLKQAGAHLAPDRDSELDSPVNAPAPHTGMPPCYIPVDGLDPLRDDGLIYERILHEHGVRTRIDVWPGVPHAHFAFLPMLKSAQEGNIDTILGIGWLLGRQDVDREAAAKAYGAPAGA